MAKAKNNDKPQEKIAELVAAIIESGAMNKLKLFKVNFLRGLFFGLGSAIGATFLLALLLFVLSWFNEIPLLGGITDTIRNTIENAQ